VASSALYVAVTFRNHVTRNLELVRKADLEALIAKAVSDVSGPVAVLTGKLESLNRYVETLGTSRAWQGEPIAGTGNRGAGQEEREGAPRELDALEAALLEAETYVARAGWGQPPRLFSLARKSSLGAADRELAAKLDDAEPDALIPVLQEDVPPGDPFDVLAAIDWPEDVSGCVLVTEIVMLSPAAGEDAPGDPAEAAPPDRARPDGRAARLAVGVTRTGGHLCGLRLEGDDDVTVGADLADDIVTALLGTFWTRSRRPGEDGQS
jgi:hypothetical protein